MRQEEISGLQPFVSTTQNTIPEKKNTDNAPRFQRPQSISITNFEEKTDQVVSDVKVNALETDLPFTEETVQKVWASFIQSNSNNPAVKSLLINQSIELVGDNNLQMKLNNVLQEKEIQQLGITEYFRREIKNSKIRIGFEVIPESEQTTYLSDEDLYKKMVEENPALEKLRKDLRLEID